MKRLTFIFCLFSLSYGYAQFDTIFKKHNVPFPVNDYKSWDTTKITKVFKEAQSVLYYEPDLCDTLGYYFEDYATKTKNKTFLGKVLLFRGNTKIIANNYDEALRYFKRIIDDNSFKESITVRALGNSGIAYYYMEEYTKALDLYLTSMELAKKLDIPYSNQLVNISMIYQILENREKQKEYSQLAVQYGIEKKDSVTLCFAYNNLGIAYKGLGDIDSAIYFYNKAYDMSILTNTRTIEGDVTENLGNCYLKKGDYKRANEFFAKNLVIAKETNRNKNSIYQSIASAYALQKKYTIAKSYIDSARLEIDPTSSILELAEFYNIESDIYQGLGKFEAALRSLRKSYELNDSIKKMEVDNEIANLDKQFALKQSQLQDSLKFAIEKQNIDEKNALITEKKDAQLSSQNRIIWIVAVSGILLLCLLFYVTKLMRKTKNDNKIIIGQKEELTLQKLHIEEKNKELTSSIEYAKNLQDAVIPSYQSLSTHFKETGLVFKPKDIVSGDFYWVHENESHLYFAVADCTGHGVPGAIVSMIGINGLESCMKEHKLTDPAEILTKLSEIVEKTFDSHGENVQDGMDISLCKYNKSTRELAYAGANNPVWILSNEDSIVLDPTKRPVGKYDYKKQSSTQKITISENQLICLFSDGMPDQFGGEKGKKLKYKTFKENILTNTGETAFTNADKLSTFFENWKGNLEQIDDVTVLLLRL